MQCKRRMTHWVSRVPVSSRKGRGGEHCSHCCQHMADGLAEQLGKPGEACSGWLLAEFVKDMCAGLAGGGPQAAEWPLQPPAVLEECLQLPCRVLMSAAGVGGTGEGYVRPGQLQVSRLLTVQQADVTQAPPGARA